MVGTRLRLRKVRKEALSASSDKCVGPTARFSADGDRRRRRTFFNLGLLSLVLCDVASGLYGGERKQYEPQRAGGQRDHDKVVPVLMYKNTLAGYLNHKRCAAHIAPHEAALNRP